MNNAKNTAIFVVHLLSADIRISASYLFMKTSPYVLFAIGMIIFLFGYLSMNELISDKNDELVKHIGLQDENRVLSIQEYPYKRLLLFLEDGCRPDFLFNDFKLNENGISNNWDPVFSSLLQEKPHNTICTKMNVDPPTSTTQGIKTLLTGGMRSFIEIGQTFQSSSLATDHWLRQLRCAGKKVKHVGDVVWRELAGDVFDGNSPDSDSYNVFEDDTITIQHSLEEFLSPSSKTDVLIVHSLLVDHNAHKTGSSSPSTPLIRQSLLKFREHIHFITDHIGNDTLLLVFGDHGLNKWGNHGGASEEETTTGLCAYSVAASLPPFDRVPHIRDLATTISYMFGVPIPFTNIGHPISALLPAVSHYDYVVDTVNQMLRYYALYQNKSHTVKHRLLSVDNYTSDLESFSILCSVSLIPSLLCERLGEKLTASGLAVVEEVQHRIDNTQIRWWLCALGAFLMIISVTRGTVASYLVNMIRNRDWISIASYSIYFVNFTSYNLIIHAGNTPFLIVCGCIFLLFATGSKDCSRIQFFVVLEMCTEIMYRSLVIVSAMSITPSDGHSITAYLLILLHPFTVAVASKMTVFSFTVSVVQATAELYYISRPIDYRSPVAARLASMAYLLFRCCCVQHSAILPSLSLLILFIQPVHASLLIALAISLLALRQLPYKPLVTIITYMSIALHFNYMLLPTFSFSSIHWASAFVLSHKTHIFLQAISVSINTFFAYVVMGIFVSGKRRTEVLETAMIETIVCCLSVVFNTASPVIWSVFTPFLLFSCVKWIVLDVVTL